jgi:hypothetical protein
MRVSRRVECGSHAHVPVRVTSLTLLVMAMLWVLVTIIDSVSDDGDNF